MGISFLSYISFSKILIAIISIILIHRFTKFLLAESKRKKLLAIAQKKRNLRDTKIKENIHIDIPQQTTEIILNSDVTNLVKLLNQKTITSEQILLTYYKRAVTIGLDYELIADINIDEALTLAKQCDQLRITNPNACKGYLFGIPISIKDCFEQKGLDSTYGYATNCFKPIQEDGFILKLLKEQGAIPFIRSNLPQAGMTLESVNFIWGRAKNPWDKNRTVGGSSGGEGGLIAARCSPLGIGSDIAGSIRIPALFCGVYGLKPSFDRVSIKGHQILAPSFAGQINVKTSVGPIGRSIDDLNLMMQSLLDEKTWSNKGSGVKDQLINVKFWNKKIVYQGVKKSRIGVFRTSDFFGTSKSNKRALNEVVQILKNKGHEIIEIDDLPIIESFKIFFQLITAEGDARFIKDVSNGEKIIAEYDLLIKIAELPNWIKNIIAKILTLIGFKRNAILLRTGFSLSAYEYLMVSYQHQILQRKFMTLWEEKNIDCLLLPGLAGPAIKHGYGKELFIDGCYTLFCNFMNLAAGVIPVTRVKKEEQSYSREDSGQYWDTFSQKMNENLQNSEGCPVGVQVCTLPFQEEKCLAYMKEIDEGIQFYKHNAFPI